LGKDRIHLFNEFLLSNHYIPGPEDAAQKKAKNIQMMHIENIEGKIISGRVCVPHIVIPCLY
jgi:hypothetical protein